MATWFPVVSTQNPVAILAFYRIVSVCALSWTVLLRYLVSLPAVLWVVYRVTSEWGIMLFTATFVTLILQNFILYLRPHWRPYRCLECHPMPITHHISAPKKQNTSYAISLTTRKFWFDGADACFVRRAEGYTLYTMCHDGAWFLRFSVFFFLTDSTDSVRVHRISYGASVIFCI